ncbi:MAG TPA: hypothetical protein DCQ06_04860 [Myxococcales bacterium]|nr:hypothetical protein [Myxococcales bacterium]HAN30906.1 hypothetical protein [Myxococcales bacterium]
MAVQAAQGSPDARVLRQLGSAQSWLANATADSLRFADCGQQCYHIAHVLFDKWYTQYGPRKLTKLCRQMRQGAGFEEAFEVATGRTHTQFVTGALAELEDRLS